MKARKLKGKPNTDIGNQKTVNVVTGVCNASNSTVDVFMANDFYYLNNHSSLFHPVSESSRGSRSLTHKGQCRNSRTTLCLQCLGCCVAFKIKGS